jgi:hypothetical protein
VGLVADVSTTAMGDNSFDTHVLFGFYQRVDRTAVHVIYATGLLRYGWSGRSSRRMYKRLGLAHLVASWIKMYRYYGDLAHG